jgi:replication initiation protein RepC
MSWVRKTRLWIACILQRAQQINSAGGYLRVLSEKARAGRFSVGPMLMALLRTQGRTGEARAGWHNRLPHQLHS